MRLIKTRLFFLPIFILLFGLAYHNSYGQSTKYLEAIQSADAYFNKGDYINAKAAYQYALRFEKEDSYSKQKINECIELINSQSEERVVYSRFIQNADKHFKKKEYEQAVNSYRQALKLFSFEQYPQQQIDQISRIVKEEKELLSDYQKAIQDGNRYFKSKNYNEARLEYQYALGLFPDKIYPKQRLEEIQLLLQDMSEKQKVYDETIAKANDFFNQAEWRSALEGYQQANKLFPEKNLPIQRIKELTPLVEQFEKYKQIIEDADEYYMVKDLNNAKLKYEEASKIKPGESYPREMLDKVILAIQTKATTELEDYNNAIQLGEVYITQKQWKEARSQFEFANRLKPNEQYPKDKLNEIGKEIQVEEELEKLQEMYNKLITNADIFLAAKDYEKAKQSYMEASGLFPEKTYPLDKIEEIKKIEQEIEVQKALLGKYNSLIRDAENLLNKEDYIKARLAFEEAQKLKPENPYPKEKLSEISLILARIMAEQTNEENYQAAIQLADNYFQNKNYENARLEYQKARGFKEEEEYPQHQILKIETIFKQRALETQKKYDELIARSDTLLTTKNYKDAISVLQQAKELKPEEDYPKQKITEINNIIAENYRLAKIEYDKRIADADRFYEAKVYEKALDAYQEANSILPDEARAKQMVQEITDLFAAATIAVINEDKLKINSGEIKQLPFNPIPIKDRKSNYLYLVIASSESENNLRLIVNYGKDQTKNGGVIIRLNSKQRNNIHLVRVGTQYKWFSEDNNWISLQAEGGNVEVGLIKVSKGILF